MSERYVVETKKVSHGYKRSRFSFANDVFFRALEKTNPNLKKTTYHMVHNWFYGRNENAFLEEVFTELMSEVDPDGLEADLNR